jgi:hypothetical protein
MVGGDMRRRLVQTDEPKKSPKPVNTHVRVVEGDTGTVVKPGWGRRSVGNEGPLPRSREEFELLLSIMNINLQDRAKRHNEDRARRDRKKKQPPTIDIRPKRDRMKGLFGGGED